MYTCLLVGVSVALICNDIVLTVQYVSACKRLEQARKSRCHPPHDGCTRTPSRIPRPGASSSTLRPARVSGRQQPKGPTEALWTNRDGCPPPGGGVADHTRLWLAGAPCGCPLKPRHRAVRVRSLHPVSPQKAVVDAPSPDTMPRAAALPGIRRQVGVWHLNISWSRAEGGRVAVAVVCSGPPRPGQQGQSSECPPLGSPFTSGQSSTRHKRAHSRHRRPIRSPPMHLTQTALDF